MMSRTRVWMVAALASACGYDEDKFLDDYIPLYCERNAECADDSTGLTLGFESPEDCEQFLRLFVGAATGECDYDSDKAKECIDWLDTVDCADLNGESPCDTVFSGGECEPTNTTPITTTPTF